VTELTGSTLSHDQDTVTVNDGRQSVGNDHHCATIEHFTKLSLDQIVSLKIHVGCGFVEH